MPTSVSSLSASATAVPVAGGGQRVAGETRLIVFRARQRDFFRLAVVARVVRAHRALQLGEFADHVGDQVGLGEQARRASRASTSAPISAAIAPASASTRSHALQLRTELVVIHDVREQRHAVGERLLLVLLEEELGVGQTRTHHALVAFDDIARRVRVDVRDDQEARAQLAVRVRQREVLLVRLHGQDQAFLRHLQERFLETAVVDHRPFDQRVHFVEQRFRHHHLVVAGERQQMRADGFLAVVEIRDDLALRAQRLGVVVGVLRSARSLPTGSDDRAWCRRSRCRARSPARLDRRAARSADAPDARTARWCRRGADTS